MSTRLVSLKFSIRKDDPEFAEVASQFIKILLDNGAFPPLILEDITKINGHDTVKHEFEIRETNVN